MKKEKKNKDYKKIITRLVEELRWDLFLGHWKMTIKFSDKDHPGNNNYGLTMATANANPTYANAIITVYPALIKEYGNDIDMIREVITHELSHCITEELCGLATNRYATPPEIQTANEKLVQHITRIIRWNHDPKANDKNKNNSKKNRRNVNKVSVEKIQIPKSRDGNRPAPRVHSEHPRLPKDFGKISLRRTKNKKDNNKSLAQ